MKIPDCMRSVLDKLKAGTYRDHNGGPVSYDFAASLIQMYTGCPLLKESSAPPCNEAV